jgi:hypothetical protein
MKPSEIAKFINEEFDELTPSNKTQNFKPLPIDGASDEDETPGIGIEDLPKPHNSELPKLPDLSNETPPSQQNIAGSEAKAIENAELAQNLEQELASAEGEEDVENTEITNVANTQNQNMQQVATAVHSIEQAQKNAQAEQDKAKTEKAKLEKLVGTDDLNKAKEQIIKNVAGVTMPEWKTNLEKALDEAFWSTDDTVETPNWDAGGQLPSRLSNTLSNSRRWSENSRLIAKLAKQGATAQQIADNLRLDIRTVKDFLLDNVNNLNKFIPHR